jgi:hypothetical protein
MRGSKPLTTPTEGLNAITFCDPHQLSHKKPYAEGKADCLIVPVLITVEAAYPSQELAPFDTHRDRAVRIGCLRDSAEMRRSELRPRGGSSDVVAIAGLIRCAQFVRHWTRNPNLNLDGWCAMPTYRGVGRVVSERKNRGTQQSLVCSIEEIRTLLGVGRATAYGIARELGRRAGGKPRGRLIVSRHALEAWLRRGGAQ